MIYTICAALFIIGVALIMGKLAEYDPLDDYEDFDNYDL